MSSINASASPGVRKEKGPIVQNAALRVFMTGAIVAVDGGRTAIEDKGCVRDEVRGKN
jgi:hypothetical protein